MTAPADRLAAALADRYRLERELGQGGMATVYLAEDLKHKRKVAVKVLRPELAAVLGAERFVQEITTTAALQHPHILPLFDSGSADSFLYYVMPYVEGEPLRTKPGWPVAAGPADQGAELLRGTAAQGAPVTASPDRLAAALADRYRLERELGQGGMATVNPAEDLRHERRVAVVAEASLVPVQDFVGDLRQRVPRSVRRPIFAPCMTPRRRPGSSRPM